ncbi:hypothetical protein LR002_00040 [Candidatus Gracilibacteria bacterium]|nr:hypothetical protein [Candidatus Gracilibacteria bacterium]
MEIDFLNILYLVLSVCAIVLTIFLSVFLIRGIKLIGNLNKIIGAMNTMIDMANAFLIKPLQVLEFIIEHLGKFLGNSDKSDKSDKIKNKK